MLLRSLLFLFLSITNKEKIDTLYHKIDPYSISKQLAFYELYPDTDIGKKALRRALDLVNIHRPLSDQIDCKVKIPPFNPNLIVSLSSQLPKKGIENISTEELLTIQKMASHLHNRKLKGFSVQNLHEAEKIETDQIDLTRFLLLELVEDPKQRLFYEATVDLMALEILAHLPKGATLEEKMEKISTYVFHEMEYRFPPQSIWVEEIDSYTLLPTILDSRFGVCLGVSTLYLALAQRLDLPLVPITPPGHIFVRFEHKDTVINIETTARGIHLPDSHYLSIQTKSLKRRSIREVIGLNFMNQGALYWQQNNHEKAVQAYTIAQKYMGEDPLLLRFKGLQHLFLGQKEVAFEIFEKIRNVTLDGSTYPDTQIDDLILNHADAEGLKLLYDKGGTNRSDVEKQIKILEKKLESFPKFRDGLFHLAGAWLTLNRTKEAYEVLLKYHQIDQTNPVVEYYLAALALERLMINEGKIHLKKSEELLKQQNYSPHVLKDLYLAYKKEDPTFDF
jgi:regulator of sirC expression with transglutaminase-like and TPR domain